MQKNKGLVIFLAGLGVVVAVFGLVVGILSWMDSRISVEDLTVTNITDTAFTVTWVSDSPYIGRVVYQEESQGWSPLFAQLGKEIAFDDRDIELNSDGVYRQVEGGAVARYTHHVTIRNLDPETQYEFRIAGVFNGKEAEQTVASTRPLIEDIQTPDPAYGLVEGVDNNDSFLIITESIIDENGIVAVSVPISSQGTYSFDVEVFSFENSVSENIVMNIFNKNNNSESVILPKGDYKPFPTIDFDSAQSNVTFNNDFINNIMADDISTNAMINTNGQNATIRSGPSTNDSRIDSLSNTTRIEIKGAFTGQAIDIQGVNPDKEDDKWYQITYRGASGNTDLYVHSALVLPDDPDVTYVPAPSAPGDSSSEDPQPNNDDTGVTTENIFDDLPAPSGACAIPSNNGLGVNDPDFQVLVPKIKDVNVNVRFSPNSSSEIIALLTDNGIDGTAIVPSLCVNSDNDQVWSYWYKIEFNGITGYVAEGVTTFLSTQERDDQREFSSLTVSGTDETQEDTHPGASSIREACYQEITGNSIEELPGIPNELLRYGATKLVTNPDEEDVLSEDSAEVTRNGVINVFGRSYILDDTSLGDNFIIKFDNVSYRCGRVSPNVIDLEPLRISNPISSYNILVPVSYSGSNFTYSNNDLGRCFSSTAESQQLELLNAKNDGSEVAITSLVSILDNPTYNNIIELLDQVSIGNSSNELEDKLVYIKKGSTDCSVRGIQNLISTGNLTSFSDVAVSVTSSSNADNLSIPQPGEAYFLQKNIGRSFCFQIVDTQANSNLNINIIENMSNGELKSFRFNNLTNVKVQLVERPNFETDTYFLTAEVNATDNIIKEVENDSYYIVDDLYTCYDNISRSSSLDINNLFNINQISAQETPGSRGSVLQADDEGIQIEESGNYAFFANDTRIAEQDIVVIDGEVQVRLFTDTNGNGQKDDDEDYFEDYTQITVAREASLETFQLTAGWNLIHLPLIDQTQDAVRTAGDLIDHWNDQGADIKHVARFRNGQFEMFSKRESGTEYAKDFDLVPGQGLFVLNFAGNITTTFAGNVVDQALPLELSQGWNLVGFYNPDEDLDTEIIFSKAGEQSVGMQTISQFENGQYQSVISEDGLIFGNNFNVLDKRGYFVRIEGGTETDFTP